MKAKYYFVWSHLGKDMYGHEPSLWRASDILEASEEQRYQYQKYLLSSLSTDFYPNHPEHCDFVLQKIGQIESGELAEYMWEGQGFLHYIKPHSVLFEHNIFGECPEWPLWSCSLAQYKAALQGWRTFIEMPKSIDSELIVELPD